MQKITIDNLECPAGYDLFLDSESFLDEVHESEYQRINGGSTPTTPTVSSGACFAGGVAVGAAISAGILWGVKKILGEDSGHTKSSQPLAV
ncbi:MAG: hypothetical protein IM473_05965 [Microcystis sp. M015S2]|nr:MULTISPECIES: hypothetical protein [unclassified Microcystis]MCA2708829.1 hypothetical protein [Microcystis sp. M025S2]MCA2741965.1 hypothetical protein [Microcystis sp. M015S2]MCA2758163.1 hypothetical protein [Microcystis sp. M145S2]